jgi:hypothetical protein
MLKTHLGYLSEKMTLFQTSESIKDKIPNQ